MTDAIWTLQDHQNTHYELEGNGELWIYEGISENEYKDYTLRLTKNTELVPYSNTLFGKNPAHTYLWGNKLLHTYFTAATMRVHVIVEPQADKFHGLLPNKEEPYERVCSPSFAIMALDYRTQRPTDANGMSYVFRLEDGSFIVYDGGYLQDAQRLYTYLRDHTPFEDGRIVIAAWILTHSHNDHYSCFLGFSRMFAEKVEVKRFLFNSPAKDDTVINLAQHDGFLNTTFFDYVKKYPHAEIIRVHTGEIVRLAGIEIEILQTYEDILPEKIRWLNEASLVTRVRIAGQTFLFPADTEIKGDRALERYGRFLKSDFLQITHHGYSGGTMYLVDRIDPTYLLWTTNYECYTQRTVRTWHNSVNRYLLACRSVDYSFVADGDCKVLHLPFQNVKEIEYYQYPEQ